MGQQISKTQAALEMVERFKSLYNTLDAQNCRSGIIESVYSDQMIFKDSFHEIQGVDNFVTHCESLYENVRHCEFDFHDQWVCDNDAMLAWTMYLSHPRIKKGETIEVEGSSLIRFDRKVLFHRDYFDGAQLIYEHLPVMGTLIKQIKRRMA